MGFCLMSWLQGLRKQKILTRDKDVDFFFDNYGKHGILLARRIHQELLVTAKENELMREALFKIELENDGTHRDSGLLKSQEIAVALKQRLLGEE